MAHQSTETQQCIDACTSCHESCVETLNHCLSKGGKHAAQDHITVLLDCAQVCTVNADFMLRGSKLMRETCRVCAAVCRACAESCRKMGDDAQMARTAEQCDECATSCEKMAGMSTGGAKAAKGFATTAADHRTR